MLLEALGVELIPLYAEPTGAFPRNPEPTSDRLGELCQAVVEHGAHVGFAQDPDADRLAIVDEAGRCLGEEYTFVLCARNLLRRQVDPRLTKLVANLSTSRMINDVAEPLGAEVLRSAVGEANVVGRMLAEDALAGGEGNGGIIWPQVGLIRDSLLGMALLLESLAVESATVSDLVTQVPAYALLREKLPLGSASVETLYEQVRAEFTDATLDERDGVRVDWPDRWLHVRPSNTEPIVRLIAEARDRAAAEGLLRWAREAVGPG